jgi:hypothetical protein
MWFVLFQVTVDFSRNWISVNVTESITECRMWLRVVQRLKKFESLCLVFSSLWLIDFLFVCLIIWLISCLIVWLNVNVNVITLLNFVVCNYSFWWTVATAFRPTVSLDFKFWKVLHQKPNNFSESLPVACTVFLFYSMNFCEIDVEFVFFECDCSNSFIFQKKWLLRLRVLNWREGSINNEGLGTIALMCSKLEELNLSQVLFLFLKNQLCFFCVCCLLKYVFLSVSLSLSC